MQEEDDEVEEEEEHGEQIRNYFTFRGVRHIVSNSRRTGIRSDYYCVACTGKPGCGVSAYRERIGTVRHFFYLKK